MSDFKISNGIRRRNRVFLVAFACFAALLAIVLSGKYFHRTYSGQSEGNKLSAKTLETMLALKFPIEICVIIGNEEPGAIDLVRRDIAKLLNEYADCAHGSTVRIEFTDLAGVRSKNLVESTIFLPSNSILLRYAQRRKVIAIEELYDVRNGEVVGFRGERVLTNAIANLTSERKKTIYFLTGHGEYDVADVSAGYGLSTLANILRGKGYDIKILNFDSSNVPEDADLLVLWGPRLALLPSEVLGLGKFLDEQGKKVMVGLGSASDVALIEFLADHGICANVRTKILPAKNSPKVLHDLVAGVCADHKITEELINFKVPVICGETREVREAEWTSDGDKFLVTDLLQVEGTFDSTGQNSGQNFTVATLSERRASIAVDILASKLLVFGCSDFATNARINILGNRMLFCGAVDYLCGAGDTTDIASRRLEKYRLALTDKQRHLIATINCVICCCFAAAGVLVHVFRKK
jgi:hypothetical protein